jgi:hypothetical protein
LVRHLSRAARAPPSPRSRWRGCSRTCYYAEGLHPLLQHALGRASAQTRRLHARCWRAAPGNSCASSGATCTNIIKRDLLRERCIHARCKHRTLLSSRRSILSTQRQASWLNGNGSTSCRALSRTATTNFGSKLPSWHWHSHHWTESSKNQATL